MEGDLNARIKEGDVVLHFKHELDSEENLYAYLYVVRAIATHTETGEQLVIYQNSKTLRYFARPLENFVGKVDKKKYPTVKQEYRFVPW